MKAATTSFRRVDKGVGGSEETAIPQNRGEFGPKSLPCPTPHVSGAQSCQPPDLSSTTATTSYPPFESSAAASRFKVGKSREHGYPVQREHRCGKQQRDRQQTRSIASRGIHGQGESRDETYGTQQWRVGKRRCVSVSEQAGPVHPGAGSDIQRDRCDDGNDGYSDAEIAPLAPRCKPDQADCRCQLQQHGDRPERGGGARRRGSASRARSPDESKDRPGQQLCLSPSWLKDIGDHADYVTR
jgi:hypothetical protein